jgi:hypothetical protein
MKLLPAEALKAYAVPNGWSSAGSGDVSCLMSTRQRKARPSRGGTQVRIVRSQDGMMSLASDASGAVVADALPLEEDSAAVVLLHDADVQEVLVVCGVREVGSTVSASAGGV